MPVPSIFRTVGNVTRAASQTVRNATSAVRNSIPSGSGSRPAQAVPLRSTMGSTIAGAHSDYSPGQVSSRTGLGSRQGGRSQGPVGQAMDHFIEVGTTSAQRRAHPSLQLTTPQRTTVVAAGVGLNSITAVQTSRLGGSNGLLVATQNGRKVFMPIQGNTLIQAPNSQAWLTQTQRTQFSRQGINPDSIQTLGNSTLLGQQGSLATLSNGNQVFINENAEVNVKLSNSPHFTNVTALARRAGVDAGNSKLSNTTLNGAPGTLVVYQDGTQVFTSNDRSQPPQVKPVGSTSYETLPAHAPAQPPTGGASFSAQERTRALSNLRTLDRLLSELSGARSAPGHSRRATGSQQSSTSAPNNRLRSELQALRNDLQGGRISPAAFQERFSAANRTFAALNRQQMEERAGVARREANFAAGAASVASVARDAGLGAACFFGPGAAAGYAAGTRALSELSYAANGLPRTNEQRVAEAISDAAAIGGLRAGTGVVRALLGRTVASTATRRAVATAAGGFVSSSVNEVARLGLTGRQIMTDTRLSPAERTSAAAREVRGAAATVAFDTLTAGAAGRLGAGNSGGQLAVSTLGSVGTTGAQTLVREGRLPNGQELTVALVAGAFQNFGEVASLSAARTRRTRGSAQAGAVGAGGRVTPMGAAPTNSQRLLQPGPVRPQLLLDGSANPTRRTAVVTVMPGNSSGETWTPGASNVRFIDVFAPGTLSQSQAVELAQANIAANPRSYANRDPHRLAQDFQESGYTIRVSERPSSWPSTSQTQSLPLPGQPLAAARVTPGFDGRVARPDVAYLSNVFSQEALRGGGRTASRAAVDFSRDILGQDLSGYTTGPAARDLYRGFDAPGQRIVYNAVRINAASAGAAPQLPPLVRAALDAPNPGQALDRLARAAERSLNARGPDGRLIAYSADDGAARQVLGLPEGMVTYPFRFQTGPGTPSSTPTFGGRQSMRLGDGPPVIVSNTYRAPEFRPIQIPPQRTLNVNGATVISDTRPWTAFRQVEIAPSPSNLSLGALGAPRNPLENGRVRVLARFRGDVQATDAGFSYRDLGWNPRGRRETNPMTRSDRIALQAQDPLNDAFGVIRQTFQRTATPQQNIAVDALSRATDATANTISRAQGWVVNPTTGMLAASVAVPLAANFITNVAQGNYQQVRGPNTDQPALTRILNAPSTGRMDGITLDPKNPGANFLAFSSNWIPSARISRIDRFQTSSAGVPAPSYMRTNIARAAEFTVGGNVGSPILGFRGAATLSLGGAALNPPYLSTGDVRLNDGSKGRLPTLASAASANAVQFNGYGGAVLGPWIIGGRTAVGGASLVGTGRLAGDPRLRVGNYQFPGLAVLSNPAWPGSQPRWMVNPVFRFPVAPGTSLPSLEPSSRSGTVLRDAGPSVTVIRPGQPTQVR